MTPNEQSLVFLARLGELEKSAAARFEILRQANVVAGDFSALVWTYAGRKLCFAVRPAPGSNPRRQDPLLGVAGVLARCFMVSSMEAKLSAEGAYARLQGLRWLAETIGGETKAWVSLSPTVLNRVIAKLKAQHTKAATVYNRASALTSFVDFLNATRIGSGKHTSSLLGRYISWKSGLKNPIRHTIEVGHAEALASKKYRPDLHRVLGETRSRIRLDPTLEPSPGYDLIRLEALTFAMATGMRIGELCALSLRCLETDEKSGAPFLRVATEKGQPPSARPIADVWSDPVSNAYDYLLQRCAAARSRAREIEEGGFSFVAEALQAARRSHPISAEFQAQLEVLGLSSERYYLIEEIVATFDLATKEFCADGRFRDCAVDLPRIVAARVVRWIDMRMAAWDWVQYSKPPLGRPTAQVGSRVLPAATIARHVGGGPSCLPKARWFFEELQAFLVELSEAGVLEGAPIPAAKSAHIWDRWHEVRELALGQSGGGKCTAIDIERFCLDLAEKYRSDLEQHFRDVIAYDDDGAPVIGGGVRPGVPERLSDHLIVVWEGEFSGRRNRGILPRPISRSDFYNYLSTNGQKRTVFERLDIRDQNGKPYSISPHQIRHWVTTAIFRSGPSEMMVDLWMGRTPGQSRVYDHRTAKERAEAVRDRYLSGDPPDDYLGRRVRLWRQSGIGAEELEDNVKSRLRVMHFVPTGGCSRELFLSPCTKGLMCLRGFGTDAACPSFHVDVTDNEARNNIVALREQYRAMLAVLYPMAPTLEEAFVEELNSSEVLDQHLMHIREVIRGCDQALAAYRSAAPSSSAEGSRTIPLRVLHE